MQESLCNFRISLLQLSQIHIEERKQKRKKRKKEKWKKQKKRKIKEKEKWKEKISLCFRLGLLCALCAHWGGEKQRHQACHVGLFRLKGSNNLPMMVLIKGREIIRYFYRRFCYRASLLHHGYKRPLRASFDTWRRKERNTEIQWEERRKGGKGSSWRAPHWWGSNFFLLWFHFNHYIDMCDFCLSHDFVLIITMLLSWFIAINICMWIFCWFWLHCVQYILASLCSICR